MPFYAISYDLIKQKDYPELWKEMDRIGAQKVLLSLYFVSLTNRTAEEVKNHLLQFVDKDDRIMVIPFNSKPAYNIGLKGTAAWLKEHFP